MENEGWVSFVGYHVAPVEILFIDLLCMTQNNHNQDFALIQRDYCTLTSFNWFISNCFPLRAKMCTMQKLLFTNQNHVHCNYVRYTTPGST